MEKMDFSPCVCYHELPTKTRKIENFNAFRKGVVLILVFFFFLNKTHINNNI